LKGWQFLLIRYRPGRSLLGSREEVVPSCLPHGIQVNCIPSRRGTIVILLKILVLVKKKQDCCLAALKKLFHSAVGLATVGI